MRKHILFILYITFSATLYAQNNYWLLNSTRGNIGFKSFSFLDNNNGLAVNSYGQLFKTSTGGNNWTNIPNIYSTNTIGASYLNDSTIFIVGSTYQMAKSTNGGLTWNTVPVNISGPLSGIMFTDSVTGFAYGTDILRTQDGGNTWTKIILNNGASSITGISLVGNKGWACDLQQIIYKTTDYGLSWQIIDTVTYLGGATYGGLAFKDSLNGVMAGYQKIFKTSDGGNTWNAAFNVGGNTNFSFIKFINASVAFAGTNNGILLRSTDGGNTWNTSPINSGNDEVYNVQFFNSNSGLCSTFNGLYKTTNGGSSWLPVPNIGTTNLNDIQVEASYSAIAVGENGSIFSYVSGTEWMTENTLTNKNLNSVYVGQLTHKWIVGDSGTVIRYILPGIWSSHPQNPQWKLNSVHFLTLKNGWAVGNNGLMVFSSDSGKTWTEVVSNTSENLNSITFKDTLNGIVVGNNGFMLKTTDGGNNWNQINSGTNNNLAKVIYSHSNNLAVWAVGSSGTIIKSVDGGNNWTNINSGIQKNLNNVHAYSIDSVLAVGEQGTIINTYNSGQTWFANPTPVSSNLKGISSSKTIQNFAFICGENENILSKTNTPQQSISNISGTVYYDTTQQILPNVQVLLYKYENVILDSLQNGVLDFDALFPIEVTQTNQDGSYTFENLPFGYYIIYAVADTANFPLLASTYYPSEFAWFNAEVLFLQNNLSSADIRMIEIDSSMLGGFTINGNAVYNGTPKRLSFVSAPDKTLILYNKNNSSKPIVKVKTKQDGSFTFKTDSPGEYGIHLDLTGTRIDTSYSIQLSSSQVSLNNLYIIIDSTEIIFDIISGTENIQKDSPADIKIYPNPNNGNIYIHNINEVATQIIIYDISGVEIINRNIKSSENIIIPEKYEGLLLVKLISAEKTLTKKIIVVR